MPWEVMSALGGEGERSLWSPRDDKDAITLTLCDSPWEVMAVLEPMPLGNIVMGTQP